MARRRIDDAQGRQALSAAAVALTEFLLDNADDSGQESGQASDQAAGRVSAELVAAFPTAHLDTVPPRPIMLMGVRWALEELAELAPGRAVEVRVPPAGAVQILGGTVHRRGTPPAVIEMSMSTWVLLAVGVLDWNSAEGAALLQASGERASLRSLLPLL